MAASSSLDSHIRIWDLEQGKQMKSIDLGPGNDFFLFFYHNSVKVNLVCYKSICFIPFTVFSRFPPEIVSLFFLFVSFNPLSTNPQNDQTRSNKHFKQ